MMLLIDIPEDEYNEWGKNIKNAIPIPDNATNERMVGSWIKSRDSYGTNHFTCPFCEHDIATRNADNWDDNYCSNCGARMVRKENNNADISN